jgi:hypothetical protein
MAAIAIPERQINAGVTWTSPSIICPVNPRIGGGGVLIMLKLNSSDWDTGSGQVDCGIEMSMDSGQTWIDVSAITNIPIGWRNAKGGTPQFSFNADRFLGKIVRLYIKPSTRIRLSLSGEII